MIYISILIVIVAVGVYVYLQRPQFDAPSVEEQSYQGKYYQGQFHNVNEVPVTTSDDNFFVGLYKFLTDKTQDAKPAAELPSQKTDLLGLDPNENIVVWMGHSSYFMQLDGQRYLIDPVFSDSASPVPGTNTAFAGSNVYHAKDIPEIDYLLITHDHWDHLDYPTLEALRDKVAQVVTPIGVGSYLTQWGYTNDTIFERDWFEVFNAHQSTDIYVLPAQHFSGRMLQRNQTLWGSFAIVTPNHKVYFGGDSGYGPHFKQINEQLGGFDLAVLETGQYSKNWPFIHMMPEETAQAAEDLEAQAVLPSHNSKFRLSNHSWYEPLDRLSGASRDKPYRLLTPLIGQSVRLDDEGQVFNAWWQPLKSE
ncbi:MBL fold metallo-hydrolase [Vibrio sp. AK197]